MRQNLPVPLTAVIGREREIGTVESLLRETPTRLVALTGPGGIGKTRLALEIAHRLNRHFPAGCAWVPLASVQNANDVAYALASAVGIETPASRSALSALCEDLAHRDMLLVVDNFEHISDAAPVLGELLQAGASLRILVTSRSLLNLSGEHHVAVGPLALPDEPRSASEESGLDAYSAVRLFLERAKAATGSFILTAENAGDVVTICRGLDGLPLAIELAAARLRHLPLPAIVARLDDRLELLVGGPRDRPTRHQTLHEAIDWSYRLLGPQEQSFFRRMAALPAGCTLDTARMLGLPSSQGETVTLALLSTLVDCSLAICRADANGEPRFGMLETIRQFGLQQLQACGERDETYRALSVGFTSLVEGARNAIGGPNQKPWLDRLDAERGSIRSICEWAIQVHEPDIVLSLSAVLWPFWVQRGNLAEGRDLLQRALASPGMADEALRANSVFRLGNLAFELHDYVSARKAFGECLGIWQRVGDEDGIACAQNGLGLIDREMGSYDNASARIRSAMNIWQALHDEFSVAIAQYNLGMVALWVGDVHDATSYLSKAVSQYLQLNNVDQAAFTNVRLGQTACLESRIDDAQALFRESLEVFTRIGDRSGEASVLYAMGYRAFLAGDEHEALRQFHDALALRHALAARDGIIECVEGIAAIAASRGNAVDAARLLAATEAYRAGIGSVPSYLERRLIETAWASVAGRLALPEIDEAKRAGATMSLDETALAALRLLKRPEAPAPSDVLQKLSAREREVFALLSEYMTDREIAERLFLSHRTVERHVGSILVKLEVKNRREAAALGSLRRAS